MGMHVAFGWWLFAAILLAGVGLLFVWKDHALLFSQLSGGLLLVVLFAILLRSILSIALNSAKAKEELPVLLGIVGLVIVILWISQGVFATQVNLKLTAQASPATDGEDTLVVVALNMENTGVRQTEIRYVSLFVCPGKSPSWPELFDLNKRNADRIAYMNKEDLGFGKPAPDEFGGDQHEKYFLVWGTQESRQVAFRMPKAAYYDIRLSVGTAETATNSINKWRSTSIVPMEQELIKADTREGRLIGKSLDQDHAPSEHRSTFEFLKKMLGTGG